MNSGFLGPAIATVLTACGIETNDLPLIMAVVYLMVLQQYLPLAVLKHPLRAGYSRIFIVHCNSTYRLRY